MKIRQDIELLRILSAFGIVWFHSKISGSNYGYAGLIFFLILSVYLGGGQKNISLQKRARRLLIPWCVWFVFYGAINLLLQKPLVPLHNGLIAGLLAGPRIHLWYLPFVFFVLILMDAIKPRINLSILAYSGAVLAIVILMTSGLWCESIIRLGQPWAQYAHAVPSIFVGVFFLGFHAINKKFSIPLLMLMLLASAYKPQSDFYAYTIGIFAFSLLLLQIPIPAIIDVRPVSQLSLGIYLLHPFLILMARRLDLIHLGIILPVIVYILSGIFVWLFVKWFPKFSRYVV